MLLFFFSFAITSMSSLASEARASLYPGSSFASPSQTCPSKFIEPERLSVLCSLAVRVVRIIEPERLSVLRVRLKLSLSAHYHSQQEWFMAIQNVY